MLNNLPLTVLPLFEEYIDLLESNLGDLVFGVYIQGSIALNDYDDHRSDIDYLTVLVREPTDDELTKIDHIHNTLRHHRKYFVSEGQYTNKYIIENTQSNFAKRYPRYSDGEFKGLKDGEVDATSLWILKRHGFSIYGREVNSIIIHVSFNDLKRAMNFNLNKYWANKVKDPELFLEDEWIEFGILTLCRILNTLENRNIVSKLQAANHILGIIEDKWRPIIKEAIRVRNGRGESEFKDRKRRADTSVHFINEMIQYCNNKYFASET
jgi:hypothetical protein